MLIQVTQEHITRGRRGSQRMCPIACALLDMGYEQVSAANVTTWTKGDQDYWVAATKEMMDFMDDFDQEVPVRPTVFIIEPIAERYRGRR